MTFLFQLPRDLHHTIFSEWLCLDETRAMDSASCSQSMRPELLHQLQRLVISLTDKAYFNTSIVRWLSLREISLKNLVLTESLLRPGPTLAVSGLRLDQLKSLAMDYQYEVTDQNVLQQLLPKVRSCQSLVWFEARDYPGNLHLLADEQLRNLNSLFLANDTTNYQSAYAAVEQHCTKLTALCLPGKRSCPAELETLRTIIRNNPHLESIELTTSLDILSDICDHCRGVKDIALTVSSISFRALAHLFLRCGPRLSSLRLVGGTTAGDFAFCSFAAGVCGNKTLGLYNSTREGICDLLRAVGGLHTFFTPITLGSGDVEALLAGSAATLRVVTLVVSSLDILKILRMRCCQLENLTLRCPDDPDDECAVLEALSTYLPCALTRLSLTISGLTLKTASEIILALPSVAVVYFQNVVFLAEAVEDFRVFLLRLSQTRQLYCEVKFDTRSTLKFDGTTFVFPC